MTDTKSRQPVIDRPTAEALADLFAATPASYGTMGLSPFDSAGQWCPLGPDGKGIPSLLYPAAMKTDSVRTWWNVAAIAEKAADLPQYWEGDVAAVLNERAAAKRRAERVAAIEAIEHPAIRAYLIERVDARGHERLPKPSDCSSMVKTAAEDRRFASTRNGPDGKPQMIGKAPYEPEPGCKATLHLKAGIAFYYTQEAYADMSEVAIPVTIEPGADLEVCRRNLTRFANALRTHNGMAGSGSTWSMALIERPEGSFVVASGRHSISD